MLERIRRDYGGRVAIARVNVDLHRGLAASMGVMGVPTIVVFSRGREVKRIVGYTPTLYRGLREVLDSLLSEPHQPAG